MIALVDTRTARLDEGVIGVVISTHERMAFALAANLELQRSLGTPRTRNDENLNSLPPSA